MSDERWRVLEEGFAKIKPKDNAEHERLEKLKEKLRASSTDMAAVLERHREEQASQKAEGEVAQRRMREQAAVNEANREALLEGLEEQADLIGRIARATARGE